MHNLTFLPLAGVFSFCFVRSLLPTLNFLLLYLCNILSGMIPALGWIYFQFFCAGHCGGQRILKAERGWCGLWLKTFSYGAFEEPGWFSDSFNSIWSKLEVQIGL